MWAKRLSSWSDARARLRSISMIWTRNISRKTMSRFFNIMQTSRLRCKSCTTKSTKLNDWSESMKSIVILTSFENMTTAFEQWKLWWTTLSKSLPFKAQKIEKILFISLFITRTISTCTTLENEPINHVRLETRFQQISCRLRLQRGGSLSREEENQDERRRLVMSSWTQYWSKSGICFMSEEHILWLKWLMKISTLTYMQ